MRDKGADVEQNQSKQRLVLLSVISFMYTQTVDARL